MPSCKPPNSARPRRRCTAGLGAQKTAFDSEEKTMDSIPVAVRDAESGAVVAVGFLKIWNCEFGEKPRHLAYVTPHADREAGQGIADAIMAFCILDGMEGESAKAKLRARAEAALEGAGAFWRRWGEGHLNSAEEALARLNEEALQAPEEPPCDAPERLPLSNAAE